MGIPSPVGKAGKTAGEWDIGCRQNPGCMRLACRGADREILSGLTVLRVPKLRRSSLPKACGITRRFGVGRVKKAPPGYGFPERRLYITLYVQMDETGANQSFF